MGLDAWFACHGCVNHMVPRTSSDKKLCIAEHFAGKTFLYNKAYFSVRLFAMSERIDLEKLERKAYLSYHQDGLLDLFLGTALLTMAVFMLLALFLSEEYLFLPLWTGMFVGWTISYAGAKKAVTVPRLGYVEFSAKQRGRLIAIWLGFVAMCSVTFVLGLLFWLDPAVSQALIPSLVANVLLLLGLVGGGVFVVLGLASGIRRFHGYGTVTLVVFVLSQFFSVPIFWPTVALGVVTTVTGAVLLVRFIRKYPKVQAGEMGDARPREE
jgi:hypothetical protein